MVEGRLAAGPSGIVAAGQLELWLRRPGEHATDGVSEPRDGPPLASARRSIEVALEASEDKGDTFPWLGAIPDGAWVAARCLSSVRSGVELGVEAARWK